VRRRRMIGLAVAATCSLMTHQVRFNVDRSDNASVAPQAATVPIM
jgi:hypothetical protein